MFDVYCSVLQLPRSTVIVTCTIIVTPEEKEAILYSKEHC